MIRGGIFWPIEWIRITIRIIVIMIEFIKKEGNIVCVVKESLIATNVYHIRQNLINRLDEDDSWDELVLDLSHADSIDSIGINLLVNLYKKADVADKAFKAVGCNKAIMDVLNLFRLDRHFDVQRA